MKDIDIIHYLFNHIAYLSHLLNIGGYTDLAKNLESFTKTIFIITDKTSFPAVPTKCNNQGIEFSSSDGITYQVTTRNDFKQKCDETLEEYKQDHRKLRIIYFKELDQSENSYKITLEKRYSYLKIYDIKELIRLIADCSTEERKKIINKFQEFYPTKISNLNFENYLKKVNLCENFINRKLLWEDHDIIECKDVLEINNSIIMGDASTGKTELLKYLNNLSVGSNRITFLYKLKNYDGRKIENLIPEEVLFAHNPLLLFDGYDEIDKKHVDNFNKGINSFISKHKDWCQIIISSRKNSCDKAFIAFDDFYHIYIKDINDKEIHEYFNKKLGQKYLDGIKRCEELNVYDLLSNPFYLVRICNAIESNKTICNRSQLLDFIFNKDYEKFKYKSIKREELLDQLKEFAEYLVLNGISFVEEDKCDLGRNEKLRDFPWLLFEDGHITFVHNNFKEYLMALKMTSYSLNKIKKTISIKLDQTYIKPQYKNIISFLLVMLDSNKKIKLHNYVLKYGKYIILDIENTSLDKTEKLKIIQKIYKEYEKKKSWANASFYKSESVAKISDSKDIIRYLINKVNLSNHRTIIVYTIEILREIDNWFGTKQVITEKVYNMLSNENIEDSTTLSNLIYFWSRLSPTQNDACNIYLKYYKHCKSSVRASANYLLKTCKLGNLFTENIIQSIQNALPLAHFTNNKNDDITDIGELMYLQQAIDQIDDRQSIIELLNYLHDEKKSHIYSIAEHVFKAINNIELNDTIIKNVYALLRDKILYLDDSSKDTVTEWIITNNLQEKIIKMALDDTSIKEYTLYDIIALIYSENKKDLYLKYILSKKIDINKLIQFLRHLSKEHCQLKELCEKRKIAYTEINNKLHDDELKRKTINNFNKILNLNKIKKTIYDIFIKIKKERLNRNDIIEYSLGIDGEKVPEHICILFTDENNTKKEITNKLSIAWQICSIHTMLVRHSFLISSEEQKQFIVDWVNEKLKQFQFETNSFKYKNDNITINLDAIYCDYFIRKFDINVSEEIYKQMLCFCWYQENGDDYSRFDFIEKKIGKDKLQATLTKYCENNILKGYPFINCINYCINKHFDILTNCVTDYLSQINQKSTSTYLYNTLIDYLRAFKKLKYVLDYYTNFPDELKLYVLDVFFKEKDTDIETIAIQDLDLSNKNINKFIKAMLRFGNKKALNLYIKNIKKTKTFNLSEDYSHSSLKGYNDISFVNSLLKILHYAYKFSDKDNYIINDIMECLNSICINSNTSTATKIIKK